MWGLVGVLSLALCVSLLPAVPAEADPLPPSDPSPSSPSEAPSAPSGNPVGAPPEKTGAGLSRPDVVSATVTARASGQRVEVLSERTETMRTWVYPDGSFSSEAAGGPVRFKDSTATGTDGWRDIDVTLRPNADGTVSPTAVPGTVVLSGGGPGQDLITMKSGGRSLSLGSGLSSDLPAPELDGSTATYVNVLPGLDVQVEVRPAGFEQSWVIKNAQGLASYEAAAPASGLASRLSVSGMSARPTTAGGLDLVGDSGSVLGRIPEPAMWDASMTTPASAGDSVADPVQTVPVDMSLESAGTQVPVKTLADSKLAMVTDPEASWLDNPGRKFPIIIDPTYAQGSEGVGFDTFVQDNLTTDQSANAELKIGQNIYGQTARSYLNFDQVPFDGAQVTYGYLSLYENYSGTCDVRRWSSWNSALATTSTRWTSQPAVTVEYATAGATKGHDSTCAADWVAIGMTAQLQNWTVGASSTRAMMLQADSETDSDAWKRFASSDSANPPVLHWNYDRRPNQPTPPTLSNGARYTPAGSSTSYTYIGVAKPTMTGTVTDPDGDLVENHFYIYPTSTASSGEVSSCTAAKVASGSAASCQLTTGLSDNTTYWARLAGDDGRLTGSKSGGREFRVATGTPSAPVVSCPSYANNSWTATAPAADLSCTISAVGSGYSAPSTIRWSVDNQAFTNAAIPQSTSASTAEISVPVSKAEGGHSIRAYAASPVGKQSTMASYQFGYGSASLTSPAASPRVTTTDTVTIGASGPPKGTSADPTATVQWRVSGATGTAGWVDAPSTAGLSVAQNNGQTAVTGTFDTSQLVGEQDGSAVSVPERTGTAIDLRVCLTYTTGTQCTPKSTVLRVPHAIGDGFPTADAGPGQVALWTGELSVTDTDADLTTPGGDLSVSRTHNSFAGTPAVQNAVFGPGWTASFDDDSGLGGAQIIDATPRDGTITVLTADGEALVYTTPTGARRTGTAIPTGSYQPADDNTTLSGIVMTVSGSGASTVLELTGDDSVVTKFQVTAASTTAAATFKTVEVRDPAVPGKTTYNYDSAGRVTSIVAPLPDGVTSCVAGTPSAGCRVLKISYATTTTATSTTAGDYAGQVSKITAQVNTDSDRTLATYQYNSTGQLVTQTDGRTSLTTAYTWTGTGASLRLTGYTPPGQAKYTFAYSNNRLWKVTRPNPASAGDGTAQIAAYVYNVPLSGTVAGLPDMTTEVNKWDQAATPTWAAAVFGQDKPITAAPAAGSTDWQYASLQFTDDQGYTINTASYGAGNWQLTADDYDTNGNIVHAWDERAIAGIRDGSLPGEAAATNVASITAYNDDITNTAGDIVTPAGTLVTDTYGPVHDVTGNNGSIQALRLHTHTSYDQGAPNSGINPNTGQPYRLPTKSVQTAETVDGSQDGDPLSITLTGYDPIVSGDKSGWDLGQATASTIDMDVSGTVTSGDITTKTRYDDQGRTIENRQPKSNGTDAGTRVTAYYTAASTGTTGCTSKPEWAGQICQVGPAAQPAGQTMPVTKTTGYTWDLRTAVEVQTSGTVISTATTSYNAQDQPTTVHLAVTGLASSQSVPDVMTSYDTATGLESGTTSTAGSTAMTYDNWGRQLTYTNTPTGQTADTATTTYDPNGNIATVVDNNGQTSYTYDGTDANGNTEHRGLVTAVKVKITGGTEYTSTGAYDPAGDLTIEKLPGNLIRRATTDIAGQQTNLVVNGQGTDPVTGDLVADQPWLGWNTTTNALDQITGETTPDGTIDGSQPSSITYTYDPAGRLTQVQDQTGTPNPDTRVVPCQTRTYTFDANGNRSGQATRPAAADGSCATTGGTSLSRAYDTADRPTTGANGTGTYVYDQLGRQTTIPATDISAAGQGDVTLSYYDTDAIRSLSRGVLGSGGTKTTYTLEGAERRLVETTQDDAGTTTVARHYTDSSDNPTWSVTTDDSTTTTTRYDELIDGDLGLKITSTGTTITASLALNTPRGDTAATVSLTTGMTGPAAAPATGIDDWSSYTEYGAQQDSTSQSTGIHYGWLGGKERATLDVGFTLMGARLYNQATGSFSSTDPVAGGNFTAYSYAVDPINTSDLSGNTIFGHNMGPHQAWVCAKFGPIACASAAAAARYGISMSETYFRKGSKRQNALQHAAWMARITWNLRVNHHWSRRRAAAFAYQFGVAHEKDDTVGNDRYGTPESDKDLFNNKRGIDTALEIMRKHRGLGALESALIQRASADCNRMCLKINW